MYILVFQTTYSEYVISLFDDTDTMLVELRTIRRPKELAAQYLMQDILDIITEKKISLKNISVIGVNQGPGPFSSLRVILATANGIAHATHIPLVGTDGLVELAREVQKIYTKKSTPVTISFLNAFGGELYYAILSPTGDSIHAGYAQISTIITHIAELYPTPQEIIATGAGLPAIQKLLPEKLPHLTFIFDTARDTISQNWLAENTIHQFKNSNYDSQLFPRYLKSSTYVQINKN